MRVDFADGILDSGTAHRKAALSLHSMSKADRSWVLEQLSETERATVEPLLEELRSMAIPGGIGLLLDETPQDNPDVFASSASLAHEPTAEQQLQALTGSGISALKSCLQHEPRRLAEMLCELRDWPWSAQLSYSVRPISNGISDSRTEGSQPVGAKFQASLLKAVLTQVRLCEGAEASPFHEAGNVTERQPIMSPWRSAVRQALRLFGREPR